MHQQNNSLYNEDPNKLQRQVVSSYVSFRCPLYPSTVFQRRSAYWSIFAYDYKSLIGCSVIFRTTVCWSCSLDFCFRLTSFHPCWLSIDFSRSSSVWKCGNSRSALIARIDATIPLEAKPCIAFNYWKSICPFFGVWTPVFKYVHMIYWIIIYDEETNRETSWYIEICDLQTKCSFRDIWQSWCLECWYFMVSNNARILWKL